MDPRWVKAMIRSGNLPVANEYTDHLVEQIVDILTTQEIHYLCTTPALFQLLLNTHPDKVVELDGAALVGTRITPEMYADFVAGLGGGICDVWYGNTLFGIAPSLPPTDGGGLRPYVGPYPQVQFTVVDKNEWTRPVEYGEIGQVRLTILQDDLFLPNILDRDQATRVDSGDLWPSDGVANVAPLWISQHTAADVY
jgi:acyl-coenzyme A synthetase/AMP-(fatty) acid ligase